MSISMRRRSLLQAGLGMVLVPLDRFPAARAAATHHAPRAQRVIFLHMAGAPSTLDLFDPKPALTQRHGEEAPASFFRTQRFAFTKHRAKLLGQRHSFERYGVAGVPVASLLPHTARIVDHLTFIYSMETDQFNHQPADLVLNTGSAQAGRPSMGSWLSHALGAADNRLPAYVVMTSGMKTRFSEAPWTNGFLPSWCRGVRVSAVGEPLRFLRSPDGITREMRRESLDLAESLQSVGAASDPAGLERTDAHELAHAMQESLPAATDLRDESPRTLAAYGVNDGEMSFARNCVVARRLCERGARFVYLLDADWDHHGEQKDLRLSDLPRKCHEVDQGCAALVADLAQRGMLESTIVVWGGEFGRTPFSETADGNGRDHHPRCFTMWVAGGGFRAGARYGATDELGWDVVESPVSFADLHATMLHLLGFDHERLTYRVAGRDFRLTDVSGTVVRELLA